MSNISYILAQISLLVSDLSKEFKDYREDNITIIAEQVEEKGDINEEMNNNLKFGSICYRKDGRYMARFRFGGKQYSVYDLNKQKCIQKMYAKRKELELSCVDNTRSKTMMWKSWVEYWWQNYKLRELKESTAKQYIPYKELCANASNKQLSRVQDVDLINFIDSLETNAKKLKCHSLLKEICDKAFRNGLIRYDISCFVVRIEDTKPTEERKALTDSQVATILDWFSTHSDYKDIELWFRFTLNTGMRLGETLALTWEDIDFDKKTISINKQYNKITGKTTTTKTKKGNRVIPLFEQVRQLILPLKNKGQLFTMSNFRIERCLSKIGKETDIAISPHILRHTFATTCLNKGVNDRVVQEWLGHESVSTTQNIYQHINALNENDTQLMEK